ncbi:unnamed protein product [Leptidea sinapis]|uniref:Phosphatidylethanolamine-binding protein n=1 Tax=Leptidea sinapis TaxID=189913 RepID=A0A5E4QGZ7_9NEOP|nr:unnamed protein product [Leptidea sinapis]
MNMIESYFILFSIIGNYVFGAQTQCSLSDVKNILEGCDHISGLNVTSVGGTMVNDHNCDVLLPKQVFIEEPLFQYPLADSKKFYTIIMGLALKAKETVKTVGIDYRGYKPPTPPRGTGPHRYINLLYEQADGNNFLPTVPSTRSRFMLSNWLRGKNLCGPVAATQYRVQY